MKNRDLIFTDGTTISAGTMYCVGQNYANHAKEMGSVVSEKPMIFLKPPAAYIQDGGIALLPEFSNNVHHEVELVVVIGNDCENIEPAEAVNYIAGFAVGIDITLRDLQLEAKKQGKPWAVAKGFKTSAPISNVIPAVNFENSQPEFELKLFINGELKQNGFTKDMERNPAEIISYLSKVFSLRRGDIIFTGTPEGVGQIKSGDTIKAELSNYIDLKITVS